MLQLVDELTGLIKTVAQTVGDKRRRRSCLHTQESLIRQRVFGIALGYGDLNDHDDLRRDQALQTALHKDKVLASSSTLCRFENQADRQMAVAIHEVLVEQFIASFPQAPKQLILDVDATDAPVHGGQEGRFFNGYYNHYCFLPLYIFCRNKLLVSYLRPSKHDGAKHSWAILSLLIKRLRQQWPQVEFIVRGDSGFCRPRMLQWFDHHNVGYVIGLAKNDRVLKQTEALRSEAQRRYHATKEKQRLFADTRYGAKSWMGERRVIVKAEHSDHGSNPRFVVTNLEDEAQYLYDLYCIRGEMENRIKEQQLDMFADRTSCRNWWPNQFRLLLSGLAYNLLEGIRCLALKGTELRRAQAATIRLKLLRIGAIVLRNTRRVQLLLSNAYPYQDLFLLAASRLKPG